MKGNLHNVAVFAFGVAIGVSVTWKYNKKKFEQIAQIEIDSVKEMYSNKTKDIDIEEVAEKLHSNLQVITNNTAEGIAYEELINKSGYTNYSSKEVVFAEPYMISADEFGKHFENETITLVYYADGVLTDEDNEKVDVAKTIGINIFESLDDYDDDTFDGIYIRNERLKCDYEILRDAGDYADLVR